MWLQPEELIWHKPDGGPMGNRNRPRRNFEYIIWFSKIQQPFMDLRACGKLSDRIGCESTNRYDNLDGTNSAIRGVARVTDFLTAHGIDRTSLPEDPKVLQNIVLDLLAQLNDRDLVLPTDVISANSGAVDRTADHPALFPRSLFAR